MRIYGPLLRDFLSVANNNVHTSEKLSGLIPLSLSGLIQKVGCFWRLTPSGQQALSELRAGRTPAITAAQEPK